MENTKKLLKLQSLIIAFILSLVLFCPKISVQKVCASSGGIEKIVNCVVLVRVNGAKEYVNADYLSTLDAMYNTSKVSMKNFFAQESLGALDVSTKIVTESVSIELDHTAEYYAPKYSYNDKGGVYEVVNEEGYDNRFYYSGEVVSPNTPDALQHIERTAREQSMLRELAGKLNDKLKNVSADNDGDGEIDALTVILDHPYSKNSEWDSILWPHMTYAYKLTPEIIESNFYLPSGYYESNMSNLGDNVVIDGLTLDNYNFLTTGYITQKTINVDGQELGYVGVLCHEFLHNLGLYDYYSYNISDYDSVGELDILGTTRPIPQFNLSYLRYKKGWLKDGVNILPLEKSGHYELEAVTKDNPVKAYKLVLNDFEKTGEYFMLEMRSNADADGFDGMLSGSGLVVYRVNENNCYINENGEFGNSPYGNMYGGKGSEEVYVYREGCWDYVENNGESLAILDGSEVSNGVYYDKRMFGTTDPNAQKTYKTKETGSFIFKRTYNNTTIHYGDDKNSGVAITNITLSQDKTKVSFDIEFDDASGNVGGSDSATIKASYGKKLQTTWSSPARKGNAYVLVVENKDGLVEFKNGSAYANKLPTAEEMLSGQMSGYRTINHAVLPISYKQVKFDNPENDYAVFVMLDDGQSNIVKFAGAMNQGSKNFVELITQSKVLRFAILGGSLLIVLVVVLFVFGFRKRKV